MLTPSTIYWITRVDDIRTGLAAMAFIAVGLALVMFLATVEIVYRDNETKYMKLAFCFAAAFALFAGVLGGVRTFVPTTRDAAAMAVLPALANSEKVQTVGNAVYDLEAALAERAEKGKEGEDERRAAEEAP